MLEADVKAGLSWLKNKWYTMTNTFIKKGEEQMKQAMTMMNKLFRAGKKSQPSLRGDGEVISKSTL